MADAFMKLSIIIPAYNEEKRIERTLRTYSQFFENKKNIETELLVVLNGCVDGTHTIVERISHELGSVIRILDLEAAGKGLAIKAGFADALKRGCELIGFVDADMATKPEYFFDLIMALENNEGVIGSRYMPGAQVYPPRPWIKRWGSRIIYESLVRLLFGLPYHDMQCGAKVFKRHSLAHITPLLTVRQWAFDVELLYLYKKYGYQIKEHPTVWYDQDHSKLTLKSGLRMLGSLFVVRLRHSPFKFFLLNR